LTRIPAVYFGLNGALNACLSALIAFDKLTVFLNRLGDDIRSNQANLVFYVFGQTVDQITRRIRITQNLIVFSPCLLDRFYLIPPVFGVGRFSKNA
jgi:hypothetical protein